MDTTSLAGRDAADAPASAALPGPASTRGTAARRRSRQWTAWAFLTPVVAYLLLFYAYPLYRNIDLSLRNYTVRSFVQGNAPFIGLDNYSKVLHDPTFGPALRHTVIFTLGSLFFQFTIGL